MTTKNFKAAACIATLALVSFNSCTSEDTIIEEQNAQKEIRFNVTTSHATRGERYYEDATKIDKFKVSAWIRNEGQNTATFADMKAGNNYYFDSESLKLDGSVWAYASDWQHRYWPANKEALDFYAWVDNGSDGESKGYTFNWTNGSDNARPCLTGIKQLNADQMVDLLTAYNGGTAAVERAKNLNGNTVTLDYKHSFAQVGVNVSVVNPNIHMEIEKVALVNISEDGVFYFDNANGETANWVASGNKVTAVSDVKGSNVKGVEIAYSNGDTGVNVTDGGKTFMVIPATYTVAATADDITADKVNNGTCIGIKCKIWNVADGKAKNEKDQVIYGTSDYQYLYVPVTFDWEMGTSYTYNISFGKGNAGFDSNGNPTLVKMEWKVTMDNKEWKTGTTTNQVK